MRKLLLLTLAAVAIYSLPAEAQVYPAVPAARIVTVKLNLQPATRYEWSASVTSGNANTVVHLVQNGHDLIRGFSPSSNNTTLRFRSFYGGPATLVIRASQGSGTINVTQRSGFWSLGPAIPLASGGRLMASYLAVTSGADIFYETAQAPGGITDPVLYALDGSGDFAHIIASDEDSGVGNNASLSHPGVSFLMLGTENPSDFCSPGQAQCTDMNTAHIYENDRYNDSDNDGLGDDLEAALGTCPDHYPSACTIPGAEPELVANTRDTDGDGLSDGDEVFGVDDSAHPQYLSRWGADPMHKDVFVEVDRRDPASSQPTFSAAQYDLVSLAYGGGDALDLRNPDGLPGINVHVDAGVDPTAEELAANPSYLTAFGDWGGFSAVPGSQSYKTAADTFMDPVRHGVFHYGLRIDGSGSSGQAVGGAPEFFWNGNSRYFIHELGHTLGLAHQGAPEMPNLNCKPNYISAMNYTYDFTDFALFSDGSNSILLNPANLDEQAGIGSLDPRFMGDPDPSDSKFPQIKDPSTGAVDWDFSGTMSREPVRAPVTFRGTQVCGAGWKNPQSLDQPQALGAASPALIRVDDRLLAFWLGRNGRVSMSQSAAGGADAQGSCPLSDAFETECASWTAPVEIDLPAPALSVDAAYLDDKVFVLFRDPTNRLYVASFTQQNGSLSSSGIDALQAATALEPELAKVYFRDRKNVLRVGLGVYFVGSGGSLSWIRLWHKSGALDAVGPQPVILPTAFAATFAPTFAPALEAWPDTSLGDLSKARNCMAAPQAESMEFFCDTAGNHKFVHKDSLDVRSASRPSLEYRLYRASSGRPLDNRHLAGNFWLSYNQAVDEKFRTYVFLSRPFSGGDELTFEAPEGLHDWKFNLGGRQTVVGGTGVTLYMDDDTSALKGLAVQPYGLDTENGTGQVDVMKPTVTFLPFADGTFRVDLEDSNDWTVMADRMCEELKGSAWCNGF